MIKDDLSIQENLPVGSPLLRRIEQFQFKEKHTAILLFKRTGCAILAISSKVKIDNITIIFTFQTK